MAAEEEAKAEAAMAEAAAAEAAAAEAATAEAAAKADDDRLPPQAPKESRAWANQNAMAQANSRYREVRNADTRRQLREQQRAAAAAKAEAAAAADADANAK